MTLYYHSPNTFPIEVVSIIGLSAKVEANPIGRFGTGLKYAIAVILRNGGSIQLQSGSARYTFRTRDAQLRDTAYSQILMDGPDGTTLLPFTLDYGRDWALWQAHRELFSNCLDEHGGISTTPVGAATVFIVEGLDEVYKLHNTIFLDDNPRFYADTRLELIDKPSSHIYYRGIRVMDLPAQLPITINALAQQSLTEDRTLNGLYTISMDLTKAIVQTTDAAFAERMMAFGDKLEPILYHCSAEPGPTFLAEAKDRYLTYTLAQMVASHKKKNIVYEACELDTYESQQVEIACGIVRKMMSEFRPADIKIVASLGQSRGVFIQKTGEICIAKSEIAEGMPSLVATIFEEAAHKYYGMVDTSRSFQDFLLRRMVNFAMRSFTEGR